MEQCPTVMLAGFAFQLGRGSCSDMGLLLAWAACSNSCNKHTDCIPPNGDVLVYAFAQGHPKRAASAALAM